jgi:hypothetical protein
MTERDHLESALKLLIRVHHATSDAARARVLTDIGVWLDSRKHIAGPDGLCTVCGEKVPA